METISRCKRLTNLYRPANVQGAYYLEAMGMKSLKMQTLSRCKRRTKLYGPANISFSLHRRIMHAVNGNSRTFTTNPSSVQRLH